MRFVTTLVLLACAAVASDAQPSKARFDFHESEWVNLHHFLYITARGRLGLDAQREAVRTALADTAGFGGLAEPQRLAWDAAVRIYQDSLSRQNIIFDSAHVAIKAALAAAGDGESLSGVPVPAYLRRALEGAAPAYRSLWWPRHRQANSVRRRELDSLRRLYGDSLEARMFRVYRREWPLRPIRVDISAHANWSGVFTTTRPPHIMLASMTPTLRSTQGLEIFYHESGHILEDSLTRSLIAESRRTGILIPDNLTHALLFYTVGELTRRLVPGHVPYSDVQGLSTGAPMGQYFPALRAEWKPYLDGEISYEEAIRRLLARTGQRGDPSAKTGDTTSSPEIPARASNAITGRAFIASLAVLSREEREAAIRRELSAGNIPSFLRRLRTVEVRDSAGHTVAYEVMPDYLAIGSDDDFVRMPMTPYTAQAFCEAFGFVLPTRKMVNDIWAAAPVHLDPRPLTQARESPATFLEHHDIIEAQLGTTERGAFVAGIKKDVVVTNRLLEQADRVAIYGWHYTTGAPIQPLYAGHVDWYVDYSHGIRPVRRSMRVDGVTWAFERIVNDPKLASLLSDEGVLSTTRYPR